VETCPAAFETWIVSPLLLVHHSSFSLASEIRADDVGKLCRSANPSIKGSLASWRWNRHAAVRFVLHIVGQPVATRRGMHPSCWICIHHRPSPANRTTAGRARRRHVSEPLPRARAEGCPVRVDGSDSPASAVPGWIGEMPCGGRGVNADGRATNGGRWPPVRQPYRQENARQILRAHFFAPLFPIGWLIVARLRHRVCH
jgi:hypothetical protein